MKIKKIKRVESLKKNDVVLVSIESQQDAGVLSDISDPNVLAVVYGVKKEGSKITVLANGGYEYEFETGDYVFYVGDYTFMSDFGDIITDIFGGSNASTKEINEFIKQSNKTK